MHIRPALESDFDAIWPIIHEVVAAGKTYAIAPSISNAEANQLWMLKPQQTYVACETVAETEVILGTYYLKPNQEGPGKHVCNCGYMVASSARGRGLATAMCEHSQQQAIALGYQAMQFNLVVASNAGAVRLWEKLGFAIVGTLPNAYQHAELGLVDAHIMYNWLNANPANND